MGFEEELLNDERESRREMAFVRKQLPADLKEKFSDGQLQFIFDAIATYFVESGVLDGDDEEVDVDLEEVSAFVCKEAETEGEGPFDPQDVFFVVQGDLDFQEQNA